MPNQALPFPFTLPPMISFIILALWLLFFVAGREQLRRIRVNTEKLVLARVKEELKHRPQMTLQEFFNILLPEWEKMVQQTAWFIPHKTELFPIPARPDSVAKKMRFSADYIGFILADNQIELSGREYRKLKSRFDRINLEQAGKK